MLLSKLFINAPLENLEFTAFGSLGVKKLRANK